MASVAGDAGTKAAAVRARVPPRPSRTLPARSPRLLRALHLIPPACSPAIPHPSVAVCSSAAPSTRTVCGRRPAAEEQRSGRQKRAVQCKRRSHMTLRPCFNSLDSAGPPASARRSTLPPRVRGRRSELERAGARECGTPHKRAQQSAPTQHDAGRLNNQQPREETRRQSRAAAVPLVLPLRESGVMRVTSESASRRAADDTHDTRSTAQTRRLQSTLGKDTHAG